MWANAKCNISTCTRHWSNALQLKSYSLVEGNRTTPERTISFTFIQFTSRLRNYQVYSYAYFVRNDHMHWEIKWFESPCWHFFTFSIIVMLSWRNIFECQAQWMQIICWIVFWTRMEGFGPVFCSVSPAGAWRSLELRGPTGHKRNCSPCLAVCCCAA